MQISGSLPESTLIFQVFPIVTAIVCVCVYSDSYASCHHFSVCAGVSVVTKVSYFTAGFAFFVFALASPNNKNSPTKRIHHGPKLNLQERTKRCHYRY